MPRSRLGAMVVAISVLAAAPSAVASGGPVAAAPAAWSVVSSPNASQGNNLLAGVAGVSARDVWAAGGADNAAGNTQPLTEHWNGSAWTVVPGPSVLGNLNGIATVATNSAWAVGQGLRGALIEHWNGLTWEVATNPAAGPGTTLQGVSAASSRDVWAVGTATSTGTARTFIEHYNGTTWTAVPSPNASTRNNLLSAVAAVSPTDVWAVGDFQNAGNVFQTLVEHWNGSAWRIVASPSAASVQAGLLSVTALSSTNVWAAGNSGASTLTEHWNGTRWTVVPSPTPRGTLFNPLSGIAAASASNIWAVGNSQNGTSGIPSTLIEHWNGTSWSLVPSPSPGSQAGLSGVAADRTSGQTWAVGNFTDPVTGAQRTLTEFNP